MSQVVFSLLLYILGVLQRDPMPKLCFVMVLTSCKDFLQIERFFYQDLTDNNNNNNMSQVDTSVLEPL